MSITFSKILQLIENFLDFLVFSTGWTNTAVIISNFLEFWNKIYCDVLHVVFGRQGPVARTRTWVYDMSLHLDLQSPLQTRFLPREFVIEDVGLVHQAAHSFVQRSAKQLFQRRRMGTPLCLPSVFAVSRVRRSCALRLRPRGVLAISFVLLAWFMRYVFVRLIFVQDSCSRRKRGFLSRLNGFHLCIIIRGRLLANDTFSRISSSMGTDSYL